ncbi:alternative ribosome rescue aminoacyl-tRNA hydrolase ArfB [Aquimarina sp. 2201CG1-2-11]|uniref:alternative ribosome rescue aminoacyl-tRNA hydrolase ArfB n=1 Tax=Aquimarina discodermiae TaxID=3231043 RepID=UPI003462AEA6
MNTSILIKELKFKAIRSSGSGGQHVNKVSSKIELTFNVMASAGLTQDQKTRITQKLSSRLTKTGVLILHCDDSRSQHRNKELVIKRFVSLLKTNLHVAKKRKNTKPSKAAVKKRLENKKRQSLKKVHRKKPDM